MLRTSWTWSVSGVFAPLPVTVFPASRAAEGFQLMAAARHTGKVVIDTIVMEVAAETAAKPIRPDGGYLITGGLGALGLVAAEELVEGGARNLCCAVARSLRTRALQAIGRFRARGVNIVTC